MIYAFINYYIYGNKKLWKIFCYPTVQECLNIETYNQNQPQKNAILNTELLYINKVFIREVKNKLDLEYLGSGTMICNLVIHFSC